MREGRPQVSYILLAEFDIDEGSVLKHQYPCSTGTNEQSGYRTAFPVISLTLYATLQPPS